MLWKLVSQELPCPKPRPNGKFLNFNGDNPRYLIGRELLILMGFPYHRLQMNVSESATWLDTRLEWFHTVFGSSRCLPTSKVLASLAGNSMHIRCVMAAICAALSSTVPDAMAAWQKRVLTFCPPLLLEPMSVFLAVKSIDLAFCPLLSL